MSLLYSKRSAKNIYICIYSTQTANNILLPRKTNIATWPSSLIQLEDTGHCYAEIGSIYTSVSLEIFYLSRNTDIL